MLALQRGEYIASLQEMRRLILRWPGHDGQLETSRGWYTAELIRASGMEGQLTALLVRHLPRTRLNKYDRQHREVVIGRLAVQGSNVAKQALYANFDAANEFRLADEIVEVDGLLGLDWVITHSSGFLVPDERWRFEAWIEELNASLGENVVGDWLARESSQRPEISEFQGLVEMGPNPRDRATKPARPPWTFEQMSEAARKPGARLSMAAIWALSAPDDELVKAWNAFEAEQDEEWLRRLAMALRRKSQFCDLEKTIARAQKWGKEKNPFVCAMEEIADSRIRELAFELIESSRIVDGIHLLEKNAVAGDESMILAAVKSLTNDWDLHQVGIELCHIGERLRSPDLLLWSYEYNPCSFCREYTVDALLNIEQFPDWLLRECLYDCGEDTRELAKRALAGKIKNP